MKFGMRKPSLKKSFKARTTGKFKRKLKKSLIPGYGKKGAGWVKNPKKALYNKVYKETTFSAADVLKTNSASETKRKNRNTNVKGSENIEKTAKTPFYQKTWFMVVISILFPVVGIALLWKFKKGWNKIIKIIMTGVASIWTLLLLIICFGGNTDEPADKTPETTVKAIVKEESTTAPYSVETTTFETEETTEDVTESTTEESTTKAPTTKAPTTKAPTTKAPTTKAPTTKAPTTKEAITAKKTSGNSSSVEADYILNKNSKIFHHTWCGSVDKMKESNKIYFEGSRQDCINKGYKPCQNCNP